MASETHGSILLSTADKVSRTIMKKTGSQTGYKPSEWADEVNLMGLLPIRTASGSIAHFEDGADDVPMKSVVANITPVQDLHGYSKPWAGGAGKNKFPFETVTGTTYAEKTISLEASTYTLSLVASGNSSTQMRTIFQYTDDSYGGECLFNKDTREAKTVTLSKPVKALLFYAADTYPSSVGFTFEYSDIQLELGSTATSYEPYANVCPISGTDELTLNHKGKNLFDVSRYSDYEKIFAYNVLKYTLPNEVLLTMSFTDKDTSINISDVYCGFVLNSYSGGNLQNNQFHWTLQSGTVRARTDNKSEDLTTLCSGIIIYPATEDAYNRLMARYDIQIELGSTTTTYEPYKAETYTFDLGQEIMGGTADCVGGVGSKNKTARVIDGTEAWVLSRSGEYTTVFSLGSAMSVVDQNEQICSHFNFNSQAYATSQDRANTFVQGTSGNLFIQVSNDLATTVEGFKSWLASEYLNGTPVSYVAKTTPTSFTFTGQPINSYLGVNNLYTDSGEVLDVEYRADMNLLIAELEGNRGLQMMRATPTEENDEQEATENEDER